MWNYILTQWLNMRDGKAINRLFFEVEELTTLVNILLTYVPDILALLNATLLLGLAA